MRDNMVQATKKQFSSLSCHSAGYHYVNEMVMLTARVMKCKLNPSSTLAVVCLYHVCLYAVKVHIDQNILTFSSLSKITCSLYIRHIPYHTLNTAICTRLHPLLQCTTYFTLPHPLLRMATSHHTSTIPQ